jgi:hypothetical protein
MKKAMGCGVVVLALAAVFAIYVGVSAMSFHNAEVALRMQIAATQKNNEQVLNSVYNNIGMQIDTVNLSKDYLQDIFVNYARARSEGGGTGSFINAVQEAVPNVDTSIFVNLQNVIDNKIVHWEQNQKRILDLKREHDVFIARFPNVIWASLMNREHIEVIVVTSSAAKRAMESGEDDEMHRKIQERFGRGSSEGVEK